MYDPGVDPCLTSPFLAYKTNPPFPAPHHQFSRKVKYLTMKIFAVLVAAALAEKGKPDKINPQKRLAVLRDWYTECLDDKLFKDHKNADKLIPRVVKKFTRMGDFAEKYMDKYPTDAAEIVDDENDDQTRINRNNPCACIAGTAHAYQRFYSRLQEINGHKANTRHFGNRKWEARKLHSKIINNLLIGQFGCKVSRATEWTLASKYEKEVEN